MAVYKVPQDVEAEDKLIGPFSFRQFVFILIMVGMLYLTYLFFTVAPPMAIFPLPIAAFFGMLGLWPRKDQPVEVYLAALIHFWTQPRKKIWNPEGQAEHVIITAPKRVERQFTDGLNQYQVKSRLRQLANTLDSRGWTAKNLTPEQAPSIMVQPTPAGYTSDRLIMPQVVVSSPVLTTDIITRPEEDVLDVNNPLAQSFEQMTNQAETSRKTVLMEEFQKAMSAAPPVHHDESEDNLATPGYNPYPPEMQQNTVTPLGQKSPTKPAVQTSSPEISDPTLQNAIINLANNSDLSVSTLAHQAEQAESALHSGDTINLH